MIRNIVTLTSNDLAMAFKNKSLYLILFTPLFVFFTLQLVDQSDAGLQKIKIGLIQKGNYSSAMIESLRSADQTFEVFRFADEAEGKAWLKEKKGDGLLIPSEKEPPRLALIVLTKASFQTLAIIESVSALQNAVEGNRKHWISEIRALQETAVQKQTLPTWVLMLVLLVSFIILPAQVAEEKEKKLLLGLLQTPIRETEWLAAKLFFGMTLTGAGVLFLHLLGRFQFDPGGGLSYAAFLIAGSFCFSAFGIFVGFLCRNQASARTLGVLFYLPHLLPSALSDFSQKLTAVAPLLPSYRLYEPIRAILLEGNRFPNFALEWAYLLLAGLAACFFSYTLMKKRWLM
ncbi:ABC transporter permease [Candidatus Manganitrophus noduliformans]|uniref:ABC transporter permease n=1 Tax=Candidatus Manganitrophus noduliformans TaxID=2606439 RepID=A0A7X6DT63_9BACT|nr:ABC transporter permease [Candidatus Manganitrophus noduliformans]NKE72905.1 ABC transporter permease [Candidatus Manganitrophus noduliformans]